MVYDLDRVIDRRHSDSMKWRTARHPINTQLPEDVLPMWIADMDFRSPEPVIAALRERVDHGLFGDGIEPPELRETIVDRLRDRYGWQVAPEALVFLPGIIVGVNLTCHAFASPGECVLVQTPGYDSILDAPAHAGLIRKEMQLTIENRRYVIDFDAFEDAITAQTRIFVLCNPHNPVGRVFQRGELERMAEICLRHNLVICSDEVHCDIIYRGYDHIPIATLSPEIGNRTITLMGPTKAFNLAGLHCGFAIIQNRELRQAFLSYRMGLVREMNVMAYVATLAAYCHGQLWLDEVVSYLEANRDFSLQYVEEHLPGITMIEPEGTYLLWLDCRHAGISHAFYNVRFHKFLFENARVAVYNGAYFGGGGEGFVRLNFACPRVTLAEGLHRIREALSER
jgi:cystathionine beta-lyase